MEFSKGIVCWGSIVNDRAASQVSLSRDKLKQDGHSMKAWSQITLCYVDSIVVFYYASYM